MKKTGIDLIAEERAEQIEKHGFDIKNDEDYGNRELLQAALFCMGYEGWPSNWMDHFKKKIENKSVIEQLTVAGAFIAAEIDRLKAKEQ